jgi:hypothetical protein
MTKLNDKGQCCGRKPITYKRPKHILYCTRCSREFDPVTGEQFENWAWTQTAPGVFEPADIKAQAKAMLER